MDNTAIWILLGSLGFLIITISKLQSDITSMNMTLDKISKHLGLADVASENIDDELKYLISQGKKIKAIKRYRQVTGIGLKEAKGYIDLLSEGISK